MSRLADLRAMKTQRSVQAYASGVMSLFWSVGHSILQILQLRPGSTTRHPIYGDAID